MYAEYYYLDPRGDDTPLHVACKAKVFEMEAIEGLLRRGDDPNAINSIGCAPLHCVALNPNVDPRVVKLFVEDYGAVVDVRTGVQPRDEGETPLYVNLSHQGHPCNRDVTLELIKYGADVNSTNTDCGYRPLQAACYNKDCSVTLIAELIKHGADVNGRSLQTSEVALHWAARSKRLDAVRELLRHGADANAANYTGRVPFNCICHYEGEEKGISDLVNIIKELARYGADVNARDSAGYTFLLRHCQEYSLKSTVELVKTLLELGADPNAIGGLYKTSPLDVSLRRMDFDLLTIHELLRRGATTRKQNIKAFIVKYMKGQRRFRRQSSQSEAFEVAKLLIKYAILNNEEYLDSPSSQGIQEFVPWEEFGEHITHCMSELTEARAMEVFGDVSLYQILKEKSFSKNASRCSAVDVCLGLGRVLKEFCQNRFSIYGDVLRSLLLSERDLLFTKLVEVSLLRGTFQVSVGAGRKITLDRDCVYQITRNLTDEDLLNLVLAHFNSSN